MRQLSLFEDERLDLQGSIDLSLASLREYGERFPHWAVAYSGGKDSTATVALVAWAIHNDLIPRPESLSILYADTRMELPPLQQAAVRLLDTLNAQGFDARVVLPPLDKRFFVYILGYGVPPPKNRFRWCTGHIKVDPMMAALETKAVDLGYGQMVWSERYQKDVYEGFGDDKLLSITGVRLGESDVRDQRINISCSKDSGECGQGWFQVAPKESLADTLAPLVHWRLCHIFDWLYFENDRHGYDVSGIAAVYGEDDIRTGCAGCNLASRDNALERLIKKPEWEHLTPLTGLKPLYKELTMAKWRKRKSVPERRKDGQYSKNVQRLGPLTMEAREYGLSVILDIQEQTGMDLVNEEEEARIREMWELNVWPNKWTGDEITGAVPIDQIKLVDGDLVTQPLLVEEDT